MRDAYLAGAQDAAGRRRGAEATSPETVERARLEGLAVHADEVKGNFDDSHVQTEGSLIASGNLYGDQVGPDGSVIEPGLIDSSIVQAADGRRVVLSRGEYGDVVLQRMQEAARRISTSDDKVEDRYVFVSSAEAEAFLSKMATDKETKEAGYIENTDVARMAAERELDPREATAYEKEWARADEDALKYQLDHLEKADSSQLVAAPDSDLVDRDVVKAALVDRAREKLAEATANVQTLVNEGNQAGNDASNEFLALRKHTSEVVSEIAIGLTNLRTELTGRVAVEANADPESSMTIFETFSRMTHQADIPFEERNIKDRESGVLVKELMYHTDQTNRVVVERWNNATGNLISSILLQNSGLVEVRADPDSKNPVAFLRGLFRQLGGKPGVVERLSTNAEKQLYAQDAAVMSRAVESSGGSSGDYGIRASRQLDSSLNRLHPGLDLIKKPIKPRKRISWYERLFGHA